MNKIIFALLIIFASCTKNDTNATFTDFSGAKCGCCWGYKVTLENGNEVIAGKFPSNLNDFSAREFPFEGSIVYTKDSNCDNVIVVEEFKEK